MLEAIWFWLAKEIAEIIIFILFLLFVGICLWGFISYFEYKNKEVKK